MATVPDGMSAIVAAAVSTVVTVNRERRQLPYSSVIASVTRWRHMKHGHETVKCTWKKLFFIGTTNVDSWSILFGDTAVGTRIITSISVHRAASCNVSVSGGLPQYSVRIRVTAAFLIIRNATVQFSNTLLLVEMIYGSEFLLYMIFYGLGVQ
jgi:hypothetical protein